MAFECFAGTLTCPGSTGNQAITGVGFQPKAVMFFGSEIDSDGNKVNVLVSFGVATSSSARGVVGLTDNDAFSTTDVERYQSITNCIVSHSVTVRYLADFVSMDADGFTINWSSVQSGEQVQYLCLGGADLTNAAVVNFTSPTSTGNDAVTGAGFEPDFVFLIGGLCTAGELDAIQGNGHWGLGAAISPTSRATVGGFMADNVGTTDTNAQQIVTEAFTILNGSSVIEQADHVSMDADGFTLNWGTVNASARNMTALCLKGGQYDIGVETQKTSTGTKATTGVGFTPTGLFVMGINQTTSASVQAGLRLSSGMASGATERACHWSGDSDNVGTTVCDSDIDTGAIIKHMTEGTPSTEAEADLDSFDADGFTLDWVAADATAREFVYVAFGSNPVVGSFPAVSLRRRRMKPLLVT